MPFELIDLDDFPTIVREDQTTVGRALTRKDGEAIVAAMNVLMSRTDLRDRVLSEVADAIETCFED